MESDRDTMERYQRSETRAHEEQRSRWDDNARDEDQRPSGSTRYCGCNLHIAWLGSHSPNANCGRLSGAVAALVLLPEVLAVDAVPVGPVHDPSRRR